MSAAGKISYMMQFLADMVEGNLLAAQQEVRKLALLFPPGKLTLEAVEPAVADVARYDVFKLGETLLSGDRARFVRMLQGLEGEGVAPPLVLWAIAEEIRTLLRVATAVARRQPLQAAMREARVWGAPRRSAAARAAARAGRGPGGGAAASRGGRPHEQRAGPRQCLGGARSASGCV